MTTLDLEDRAKLRTLMRERRIALRTAERDLAASGLAERAAEWPVFRAANRIAAYVAVGGEVDPRALALTALNLGKSVYLPVLAHDPEPHLLFRAWEPATAMVENRFGIPEPADDDSKTRLPDALDLVFVPLTAADGRGNRLGQGAGYYDRTFAFLQQNKVKRPKLAGLAYEFQLVENIEPESWDVPLDYLLTPANIIDCRTNIVGP